MNRARSIAALLVFLSGTGCPHAFGRGGTIDRAIHQDVIDNLRDNDCEPEMIMAECGPERFQHCKELCENPPK